MHQGYHWFEEWFNTDYYHILYKKRDESEARLFIDRLVNFLQPPSGSHFLDLACGKGRHSLYLHSKGYAVTGVDLSEASIAHAKQFEEPGLSFIVHDMRLPLGKGDFNYVLNLFTSFGYFDDPADNLKTLHAVHQELAPGGLFIFDFFNVYKVMKELVPEEQMSCSGISFRIKRWFSGGHIYKHIAFEDKGEAHAFTEKVEAITLEQMEELLVKAGFEIQHIFGNYQLETFRHEVSDRLILIAQRI